MKKMIIAIGLLASITSQAQIMEVATIERLAITGDSHTINQAVAMSPQGDYLLLTTDGRQGLVKWDITTAQTTVLTTAVVNSSDVSISYDGRQVHYEEVSYQGKRRQHAVKSINMETGELKTVTPEGRLQAPIAVGDAARGERPVLSHHHLKLYLTRDGVTKQLAPNGEDKRYIWSSLSPDGSKVLYYVSGWGAHVCDLDGNIVASMGDITAPKWWDDNTIVGMREQDDGYTVTASSIVAHTLDGTEQTLTGDDVIATHPLPCKRSGKIVFSTPSGEIYIIGLKR